MKSKSQYLLKEEEEAQLLILAEKKREETAPRNTYLGPPLPQTLIGLICADILSSFCFPFEDNPDGELARSI